MEEITIYYINTSEIPGELLCVNMISSHMKLRCCRVLDSHCYSYIISDVLLYDQSIIGPSSEIFGNLQKCSEKFGNLGKVVGICSMFI